MQNLISILFLLLTFQFSAQTRIITGTVSDELGQALIGASVQWKGSDVKTVSDIDGQYQIEVAEEDVILMFSYTGFTTVEKVVKLNKNHLDVKMEEEIMLDEVVITSHTESRKKSDRAVAMVTSDSRIKRSADMSVSSPPISRDMVREESISFRSKSGAPSYPSNIKSGTLTAGEIHDFSKWNLWEDIAADELERWQKHWKINPAQRYSVQLKTTNNTALIDAAVRLIASDGKVIWKSRSDNTGKAELWANLFEGQSNKGRFSIEVNYEGETYTIKNADQFHNGINVLEIPIPCFNNKQIDIAFVVDATGSMGDEIDYLKVELNDIIAKVKDTLPDLGIRLGTVFYKDEGEDYVTKSSEFSTEIAKTTSFIQEQSAKGGGDFPEAVEEALDAAINGLEWSEEALGRFLFLVLDAPPHHTPEILEKLQKLAMTAAEKGIRIIPVTGSGIDKSTEYLMRSFSLMTNGTYVFLTDHSGVGGAHIEPTTDSYDVELLNDLLVRLIYQSTYVPDCDENDLYALEKPNTTVESSSNKPKKEAISWKYFPNPTSGELTVQLKGELEHLFLTDFAGKILQRYAFAKNEDLRLTLNSYPSGIYFLKGVKAEQALSGKVILAR